MQTKNSNSLTTPHSHRQSAGGWSRRSLMASFVAVPALLALTACSGAAPTPPTQPTVQAASTQIVAAASPAAATAQAGASPALATMQAGASPAMATVQAGASPAIATMQAGASPAAAAGAAVVATAAAGLAPMASPSPSPAAMGPGGLRIADASISDSTPWLSIQNSTEEAVPMAGWTLQIGAATAELPVDAVVQPGAMLTLHAGTGLSSDDELFLGNAGDALAAAAMPGTAVTLTDPDGKVHAQTTVPRF
jgi:hypothetical protein